MNETVWGILALGGVGMLLMIALQLADVVRALKDGRGQQTETPVQALALKEGDYLVATMPGHLSNEAHDRIKRNFEASFPRTKVVVLEGGMRLTAVNREHAAISDASQSLPARSSSPT